MSSTPTFAQLPLELVYGVIQHAAHDAMPSKLAWLAQLTLTSRGVYGLVTPILYDTLFLNPRTSDALTASLMPPKRCLNPLHAVRRVWVDKALDDFDEVLRVLAECPNLRTLDTKTEVILSLRPEICPSRLVLRFQALRSLTRLPPHIGITLTHLEAYHFPASAPDNQIWLIELLSMLPALSHVALNIAQAGNPGSGAATVLWDEQLDNVAACVRVVLEHPPIVRVVVHVSGMCTVDWLQIEKRLNHLRDRRLFAWNDSRYYLDWSEEERLCAMDAMLGVDVWNQGVLMWPTGAKDV